MVFSLLGSTRIWLKYMGRAFWLERNSQVRPLSLERHTPEHCGSGSAGCCWPAPPPPPCCPPTTPVVGHCGAPPNPPPPACGPPACPPCPPCPPALATTRSLSGAVSICA